MSAAILGGFLVVVLGLGLWKLIEIIYYFYMRVFRREEFERRKARARLKKLSQY